MKKRFKIVLLLFMLLSGVILALYALNTFGRYRNTDTVINKMLLELFNNNNVSVESKDLSEISITWRSEGNKKYVYRNKKVTGGIKNMKGVQVFNIYRNDRLICSLAQVKTAWWHTHDYFFKIEDNNCKCEIKGLDTLYTMNR